MAVEPIAAPECSPILEVRKRSPAQRGFNQTTGVGQIRRFWRSKGHRSAPACRGFRVDSGEDHKAAARLPLADRCRAIGKLCDHLAPTRKLRPVLPVHIQRTAAREGNFNWLLMNTLLLIRIEVE